MSLVQNLDFMSSEQKVTQVFLMLQLPRTKSDVMLLKITFLICPTRTGGLS
jgi:hypothetical protein